ncbi:MAG: hypothetical protein KC589_09410 [Nanoarchaeota archaeon]|nr:hypothetical protein [Nanoarchaeota archaeon]
MNKKANNFNTFFKFLLVFILILFTYLNQDKIVETGNKVYNASKQISENNKFNFTNKEIIYNLNENITEPLTYSFCPSQDCLILLNSSFNNAKKEIKCAFYELDNKVLSQTLLEKSKTNQINISLVIEDNYIDEKSLNILYNTSIKIYSNLGISNKYMHHKFCVIDDQILITGSTNPTDNGIFKNNNNLIKFNSNYLSQNYENEFDQLTSGKYSRDKISTLIYNNISLNYYPNYDINIITNNTTNINNTNINNTNINNANIHTNIQNQSYEISTYFCPQDNCKKELINTINSAKKEILFANFALTLDDLKIALQNKSKEGIKIEGIVEKRNFNLQGSDVKELNKTFPIHEDKNKYNMHHKFFIIDELYIITGSMNPSNNGVNYNDENIIIIKNRDLALNFKKEFYKMLN